MAEQTFDARRIAREQEGRLAAASAIGFNALKPIMQFQVSLLRLWANNAELLARNYEEGLETSSSAVEKQFHSAVDEQRQQQKAA
jgi:hypothetical protein